MLTLVLFHLVAIAPLWAATTPDASCIGALSSAPDLAAIRKRLVAEIADPSAVFKTLRVRPRHVLPQEYLGNGVSGEVIRVRLRGRDYAMKLFDESHPTHPRLGQGKGTTVAIMIQKELGEFGIASRVVCVMDAANIRKWTALHSKAMRRLFPRRVGPWCFALIMELMDNRSLKNSYVYPNYRPTVNRQTYERLLKQAQEFDSTLNALGIIHQDVDAVVTEAHGLQLMDLSFYIYQTDPFPLGDLARRLLSFAAQMRVEE